jgi:effector-binding domain-containing protein
MSDEISIVQKESRSALCISDVVGTMKLGKVMGPAYKEIINTLKEQDVIPSEDDIPFTVYRNIDWSSFDKKGPISMLKMMFFKKWHLEMGIPCPDSAKASGRMKKTELEAGKFVRAIHQGPYMKVSETYDKMRVFAAKENLALKDYSVEFYLNDPREVSAKDIRTEVLVPIV